MACSECTKKAALRRATAHAQNPQLEPIKVTGGKQKTAEVTPSNIDASIHNQLIRK